MKYRKKSKNRHTPNKNLNKNKFKQQQKTPTNTVTLIWFQKKAIKMCRVEGHDLSEGESGNQRKGSKKYKVKSGLWHSINHV